MAVSSALCLRGTPRDANSLLRAQGFLVVCVGLIVGCWQEQKSTQATSVKTELSFEVFHLKSLGVR